MSQKFSVEIAWVTGRSDDPQVTVTPRQLSSENDDGLVKGSLIVVKQDLPLRIVVLTCLL